MQGYDREYGYDITCMKCGIVTDYYGTEEEAINAWNKAMGERTVKAEQYDWDVWFCPNCNQDIGWKDKYCCGCGTRLEWDELLD